MQLPVLLSDRIRDKARVLGIHASDIDESFVRGGGHGGQKINKTSNCVFLLHRPTGTMVKCQAFRERERNRAEAFRILVGKIEQQILGKASERAQKAYKIKRQKQRRSRKVREKMKVQKQLRSAIKGTRGTVRER